MWTFYILKKIFRSTSIDTLDICRAFIALSILSTRSTTYQENRAIDRSRDVSTRSILCQEGRAIERLFYLLNLIETFNFLTSNWIVTHVRWKNFVTHDDYVEWLLLLMINYRKFMFVIRMHTLLIKENWAIYYCYILTIENYWYDFCL